MNAASDSPARKPPRFYYGWIIVCISFLAMGFHNSARFSFGIFQRPLIEEFGWSRGALGGAFALMLAIYALSGPLAGSLFDKKGPRAVMPWGSILIGCTLVSGYFISSLWHIYLLLGLGIGFGMSLSGFALHGALMPRWFQRKRGLATGIMLAGGGVGTLFLFPAIERLIAYVGWRSTYLILGASILIIMVPIKLIFLRDRPEDVGQAIDGLPPVENPPEAAASTRERPSLPEVFREVRGDRRFWSLAAIVFFIGLNSNTIMSQLPLFLDDSKYSTAIAALLFGGLGLVRLPGSIILGRISDIIGRPRTQALSAATAAAGLAILLTLPATGGSLPMAALFVLVYGFGIGGLSACHSAMSADAFGGRNFGAIMGFLEICFGTGGMLGPPAAGFIFDRVGSYNIPFTVVMGGLISISFVCLFVFPKEPAKAG